MMESSQARMLRKHKKVWLGWFHKYDRGVADIDNADIKNESECVAAVI